MHLNDSEISTIIRMIKKSDSFFRTDKILLDKLEEEYKKRRTLKALRERPTKVYTPSNRSYDVRFYNG